MCLWTDKYLHIIRLGVVVERFLALFLGTTNICAIHSLVPEFN